MKETWTLSDAARLIHEHLRLFDVINGRRVIEPHWETLSEHRKNLMINQIVNALAPGITPERQHDRWTARMTYMGYTFGEKHDHAKKKHPSLVPWECLPEKTKYKTRYMLSFARNIATLFDADTLQRISEYHGESVKTNNLSNGIFINSTIRIEG